MSPGPRVSLRTKLCERGLRFRFDFFLGMMFLPWVWPAGGASTVGRVGPALQAWSVPEARSSHLLPASVVRLWLRWRYAARGGGEGGSQRASVGMVAVAGLMARSAMSGMVVIDASPADQPVDTVRSSAQEGDKRWQMPSSSTKITGGWDWLGSPCADQLLRKSVPARIASTSTSGDIASASGNLFRIDLELW